MSDIAEATNVGASALYRHFPSKADLLVAAIRSGLAPLSQALSDGAAVDADPPARLAVVLRRLAESTLEHRSLGVLWQREARNLSDDEQRELRGELRDLTGGLSSYLLEARPELDSERADVLAWCAMGALVSISFHSLELPRSRFVEVLLDLATTITSLPMPGTEMADDPPTGDADEPESRRDALISAATELFADHGYAATGIDEIGDAAGIAGPSVYSHFASKQEILVAALQRATAILKTESDLILGSDDPAPTKLARLAESYVRVANRDRFVIRTLISEMSQLPQHERDATRKQQRAHIDDWVGLLRKISDVDPVTARIRVQAVLLVVNDAVQTPHLRSRAGFERTLTRLSTTVLGLGLGRRP